jgi:5-methylcytosine-specific restriction enzyme subunit McrC
MLTVSEHGRIFLADVDESLPDGNLKLRPRNFHALLSILDEQDDDDPDYTPIFTYLRPRGEAQLKVQNYVGVVRIAEHVQIEVLPKISKRMESKASRDLLVRMLIELEDSPFFEGNAADLRAHEMPIFELLLRCFLEQVVTIVRKGIARTYVSREDNLVFIRGKIQIGEHLRRNSYNASRVFCEFDEYEADRPINRLIKSALEIVARLAADTENQQRCRELLFWFNDVPATRSHTLDFQRMQRDRLIQHYAPAMPLCRLILENLNPLTQQGENEVVSMLFPMERVFEDFVAAKLPDQLRQWRVSTQVPGQALVENHRGRKIFNLRPDLMLSRGPVKIIADTKWKLINENERGNKYGISQADIYQLFGYSRKYLENQQFREVLLIYPASDTFTSPLDSFWYREGNEILYVVPYDLNKEALILPTDSLLNNDLPQVAAS